MITSAQKFIDHLTNCPYKFCQVDTVKLNTYAIYYVYLLPFHLDQVPGPIFVKEVTSHTTVAVSILANTGSGLHQC